MKTIRASEIGNFLFCRRAWWYHQQGVESENKSELAGGSEFHRRHGRSVMAAGLLKSAGWLLLLLAVLALAAGITLWLLG
ncbi:MAG: hypothetical protein HY835_07425 [Anaerolineae bacterium]|nr:hypothetical protein [Anaerolineae bacterium]